MGLLEGKNALVFGVANDHSIAWGIAQALHAEGATVGFSSIESLIDKRVRPLADSIGSTFVEPCRRPVGRRHRARLRAAGARPPTTSTSWSMPSPSRSARTSRAGSSTRRVTASRWRSTCRAYSLVALTRAARPYLRRGSSVMTLTYYGSEKVVANYNVMGVAKAALEASRPLSGLRPRSRRHPRQRDQRGSRSGRSRRRASPASRRCTGRSMTSPHCARTSRSRMSARPRVYLASDLSSAVTGEVDLRRWRVQHPRRAPRAVRTSRRSSRPPEVSRPISLSRSGIEISPTARATTLPSGPMKTQYG